MSTLLELSRRLLAHTIWADRHHLAAARQVEPAHLVVETGTSFGSLLGTFAHLLGVERLWLGRFVGTPLPGIPGPADYPTLEALSEGFEEHWTELEFFLASLSDEQLTLELTWVDTDGVTHTRPLWQPLVHMAQHSAYHRGQLTTLLRQLGYEPPATDLMPYLARG